MFFVKYTSCKSHVSCVVFAFQATGFWYTQNEILYMVFDSSCYHHNGKCLTPAKKTGNVLRWQYALLWCLIDFFLAWRINFTSLRLVSVHIALYIKKDCCAYKVYDILAKHYLVKKYVEVNFRGEMLWMFWQRDAWTNFSVTPYSISGYWFLLTVSALIFVFLPMPCDIYWTIIHMLASRRRVSLSNCPPPIILACSLSLCQIPFYLSH